MLNVNLACGGAYLIGADWLNLDYVSTSAAVQHANLLGRLPIADDTADLVYSSYFLENIPRDQVAPFVQECWRILKPSGLLSLVVPDLENLFRTYPAATCLWRTKGKICKCRRAPSPALGFPKEATAFKTQRLLDDRAVHGIHQPRSRFPLPFPRSAFRWPPLQGRRVPILRGIKVPVTFSDPATSVLGDQHG